MENFGKKISGGFFGTQFFLVYKGVVEDEKLKYLHDLGFPVVVISYNEKVETYAFIARGDLLTTSRATYFNHDDFHPTIYKVNKPYIYKVFDFMIEKDPDIQKQITQATNEIKSFKKPKHEKDDCPEELKKCQEDKDTLTKKEEELNLREQEIQKREDSFRITSQAKMKELQDKETQLLRKDEDFRKEYKNLQDQLEIQQKQLQEQLQVEKQKLQTAYDEERKEPLSPIVRSIPLAQPNPRDSIPEDVVPLTPLVHKEPKYAPIRLSNGNVTQADISVMSGNERGKLMCKCKTKKDALQYAYTADDIKCCEEIFTS